MTVEVEVEMVIQLPVSCLSFFSVTGKTAALHPHIRTIIPLFLLSYLGETGAQGRVVYPTRIHFHPHQEKVYKIKSKLESKWQLIRIKPRLLWFFFKYIMSNSQYLIQLPSAPSSLFGAPHTIVSIRA
ncbi:hypothetical protein HanIR_Chr02g0093411 [Helianthus annuus]|nr:hypothetical protein HanIR_Chr02g0093411 [Helianthus annuus]